MASEKERIAALPKFNSEASYTPQQLEDFATRILMDDREGAQERRREITARPLGNRIMRWFYRNGEGTGLEIAQSLKTSLLAVVRELQAMGDEVGSRTVEGKTLYWRADQEEPVWLSEDQLDSRGRREIYATVGVVDPSVHEGIYNRVYPDGGRQHNPTYGQGAGASFYRQ